ncbi:protein phosphatase 2C domain-containing protein [Streptomyces sp. NPDC001941]|uniref:protein phosphatase 2C domain-containing protein n=1 Tax=Streptomyces sp. NPDC001941 TaxID=3154659 RepID=UPI003334884F
MDPRTHLTSPPDGTPPLFGPMPQPPGYGAAEYGAPTPRGPEHPAPEYRAPEYRPPEHPAPPPRGPEHPAPEYRAPEYRPPEHPAPPPRGPEHRTPEHPAPEYRAPEYRPPAYEVPPPPHIPDYPVPPPGAAPEAPPGQRPPAAARSGPPARVPPAAPEDGRGRGPAWRRLVLGTGSPVIEARPPAADTYRPDTLFDGWSTPGVTLRLASVRGDAHRADGSPRQDDLSVAFHEPTGAVVFAVADGVSRCPQSHVGATLACRTAVADVLRQLGGPGRAVDWQRTLSAAAFQLFMRVTGGADPTPEQRQEAEGQYATTLVTGLVEPGVRGQLRVCLVSVGDTGAWLLYGGEFRPLVTADKDGEGVYSAKVSALPRLPAVIEPKWYDVPVGGALLIGTDGFGDPLGGGSGPVGRELARVLASPPRQPGELAHALDFSRETEDDDRTLLAFWHRDALERGGGEGGP